jgi:hypothetical protein
VNQVSGDKAAKEPDRPQQQQHDENYPQHNRTLLISKTLSDLLNNLDKVRVPNQSGLGEEERLGARSHISQSLL